MLTHMTSRFGTRTGAAETMRQSYGRAYGMVERQAAVLAYIDVFWIMGTICLLAIGFLFFAKKTKPGGAAIAH